MTPTLTKSLVATTTVAEHRTVRYGAGCGTAVLSAGIAGAKVI